jgi:hypothetical protein
VQLAAAPIIGARIEKRGRSAFSPQARAYLPILTDVGKCFIALIIIACACRLYVMAQGMSDTESLTTLS